MFSIPILIITFNRPNHVRQVLNEIRKQQPVQLYVCQDGARDCNTTDIERIQAVREVINELVDWPCELHTLYQEHNLGCGPGPAAGISWFFEHVDMGIIMEDDCLPHPDFFAYCKELLQRYENDKSIHVINAALYHNRWSCKASYGYSRYIVAGAWAGWKRTWKGFDLDVKSRNAWHFRKQVKRLTKSTTEANWWYWKLKEIQEDTSKKSYWDYQMQMTLFRNGAMTIHPQKNLISNIGFDAEGTHTLSNDGRGDREVYPILPLVHPDAITINHAMDVDCFGKTRPQSVYKNLVQFVYQYMLRSNGVLHAILIIYKKLKNHHL